MKIRQENHWIFRCEKFRKILHYNLRIRISKAVISLGALDFHQSVKMHISKTLKKLDLFKSAKACMHYIINIAISISILRIAIFCKYRINIVSELKKWYRSITSLNVVRKRHTHTHTHTATDREREWQAHTYTVLGAAVGRQFVSLFVIRVVGKFRRDTMPAN